MGSSGEASNKGIDPSVGGLVWVRRRNGSWWPGRILGLNEVSESCVVSPRSGTPVKLLGREDASVDWYNLEKSKRVKAFRCGEYDDCIEKAKASAANSNKKAVKYARREDAIIHALEIENSRLGKDRTDIGTRADGLGQENGSSARESLSVSRSGNQSDGVDDEVSDSEKNSDSAQELSQSGISFEEPNHISSSSKVRSMQGRRRTPNDSEDDGTEGVKRMRGLEDLGIGVASKRKAMAGGLLELVQQDNATLCDSNNLNSLSNGNTVNGNRGGSSLRRKRTQVVANANEFTKKKNRRRPLTKVLESTPMVPVVACDQLPSSRGPPPGVSNGKVSGLESIESKRSISGAINNNADCNGVSHENGTSLNVSEPACDTSDINMTKENEISSTSGSAENGCTDRLSEVPLVREEKQSQGPSPVVVDSSSDKPQVGGIKRQSSQSEGVSLKNERINETGSTSSEAVDPYIGRRLEKGTSKWQLKGKRNSRKISRNRNQDSRKYVDMDDERNACLAGLEHSDGLLSRGSDKKFDCDGVNVSPGSLDSALLTRSKPVEDGHEDGSKSLIKHPSQAEPNTSELGSDMKFLTDGSVAPQRLLPHRQSRFAVHSRYRISDSSPKESDSSLYDVKVEVNANHRSPHVPLVSFMSKLNGKAIVGHPITVELLEEGFCDELLSTMEDDLEGSHTGHVKRSSVKGRVPKHLVLQPPPPQSLRKSPKAKKPGLSPKKIRKLSSLNKKSEERKTVVEKPKGPVIACIPIKLVFSRINEAVNGSARQMHRV